MRPTHRLRRRHILMSAAFMLAAGLTLLSPPAAAQFEKAVRAHYIVSLTDMDTGSRFFAMRVSGVSWISMEKCEQLHPRFANNAVRAVQAYGLVNGSGKPVKVELVRTRCVD